MDMTVLASFLTNAAERKAHLRCKLEMDLDLDLVSLSSNFLSLYKFQPVEDKSNWSCTCHRKIGTRNSDHIYKAEAKVEFRAIDI